MARFKLLHDLYRFPGFVPRSHIHGIFGDPFAAVISLRRCKKKRRAASAVRCMGAHYDKRPRKVRDLSCGDKRVYLALALRRVFCSRCGGVKNEGLDWLADNPLYTKRFAFFVGRRCRETTIKEVAEDLFLGWHTVKELEKQYMIEQLRRAGPPRPRVIGIDEIAIAKGHEYRIVVTDLERGRAIWFGGKDRSEASLDEFFVWLGPEKSGKIRLAVMDMWESIPQFPLSRKETLRKPRSSTTSFHIVAHLNKAIDKVRRQEYASLSGGGRQFIKGQRFAASISAGAILPHEEQGVAAPSCSSTPTQQHSTKPICSKNPSDQLCRNYQSPGLGIRRFFDQWCDALRRGSGSKPFKQFAQMVRRPLGWHQ